MRNKKHFKSVICLLLTMLLVFSVVLSVSAAEGAFAQTGAGNTVYFKNTANWSPVKAYVWSESTGEYKPWSGEEMTLFKDNVYRYVIPGDYEKIIFTNGNGAQTGDLTVPGDGYIYDGSSWTVYSEHGTTDPTAPTTPSVNPTTPTVGGDSKMVYCKNSAGWSTVSVYMWVNNTETNNGTWPGKNMTNIGEDIWQYEVTGNFDMIIFSNSGNAQTSNMSFPGSGYIYDNSTGQWDIYDTSPITVKSVGSDLESPQYKGTDITLSANAVSTGGAVFYKFSVTYNGAVTQLSDFTASNTVTWTPTAAGTYTITYDFKDTAGNTNQRTATYVVADDTNVVEPILKGVSPKPGYIEKGTAQTFSANAAGGKTGTNLLFYKYTVKDANGVVVNVPYYTKNASYSFTPTALGTYTVTISVQASDNAVIERTFTYISADEIPGVPTLPTLPSSPTDPTTTGYLKGDADANGDVTIMDATIIQQHLAKIAVAINLENADSDLNGTINIVDATVIQMYLAKMYPDW